MPATNAKTDDPSAPSHVNINKKFINGLVFPTREEGRQVHWDHQLKGFGVRVNPGGSMVFIVQYRMRAVGAKTQTVTIGKFGSPWTPEMAREEARSILERVHKGVDPIAARRAQEAAEKIAAFDEAYWDFDAFADRYIERHVKKNGLRSLKDIEGTFTRDLRPAFSGKSVRDITSQDVKSMRSDIGQRCGSAWKRDPGSGVIGVEKGPLIPVV